MIKRWNEFIKELTESKNYIDSKVEELKDLIDLEDQNIIYTFESTNNVFSLTLLIDESSTKYNFDINKLHIGSKEFDIYVKSIDEGFKFIENIISENKIPKKYLTHKPKEMKKEIDRFRGKKEYKKDWEADYDRRSGKRIKTKKSSATKAYQKMFGKKD